MRENLVEHQRIGLACCFIGAAGHIEEIIPTLARKHPVQPTPPLTGRHGKQMAPITKILQSRDYARIGH